MRNAIKSSAVWRESRPVNTSAEPVNFSGTESRPEFAGYSVGKQIVRQGNDEKNSEGEAKRPETVETKKRQQRNPESPA